MNSVRRNLAGFAALVVLTAAGITHAAFPDHWIRDPGNPISPEFGGSTVLYHDGIYKAWGADGDVHYATSPDGRVWTLHPDNPVLVMGPQWYDEFEIANPSVVIVDGLYHMWYSCIAEDGNNRIAHATSPDGIVWTKDGANPVMDLGPPGSLDSNELIHPFVMYEDPLFRMWYNGHDDEAQRILYAVSLDGVLWARDSEAALEPGSPGDWDAFLGMMYVVPLGDLYFMFYSGGAINEEMEMFESFGIGYATSEDGTDWVRRNPSEPVLGPGEAGAWDDFGVLLPVILPVGNDFLMWYAGTSDFESFSWGLATAQLAMVAVPEVPDLALEQNYPNPFNPRTTIRFSLEAPARVALEVYDAAGRHVRRLVDGQTMTEGAHLVPWDGRDDSGRYLAAGVYFCSFEAGEFSETKRMVLLK